MTRVYLLSDYNESGSENVRATLHPGKLESMIDEYWSHDSEAARACCKESKVSLRALLAEMTDAEMARRPGMPNNLSTGWGGLQLHVVELV